MTATEAKIEAVARAICQAWGYDWDGPPGDEQPPRETDDECGRPTKQLFREAARAALAAADNCPNAPDENGFFIGQKVEKFSGDYQTIGEIRARYTTCKGNLRYVVQIEPQGFQHIFTASNIRALP